MQCGGYFLKNIADMRLRMEDFFHSGWNDKRRQWGAEGPWAWGTASYEPTAISEVGRENQTIRKGT